MSPVPELLRSTYILGHGDIFVALQHHVADVGVGKTLDQIIEETGMPGLALVFDTVTIWGSDEMHAVECLLTCALHRYAVRDRSGETWYLRHERCPIGVPELSARLHAEVARGRSRSWLGRRTPE